MVKVMKKIKVAILMLSLAFFAAPVLAQGSPGESTIDLPSFTKGEGYNSVRSKMLKAGWEPYTMDDFGRCDDNDPRCRQRPEVHMCSGTEGVDQMPCRFTWKKAGNVIGICTVGKDTQFREICN